MPRIAMTDRAVAGWRTAGQTYFDQTSVGLALRVGARTRTWFFVYRNGGPSEWVKPGPTPP